MDRDRDILWVRFMVSIARQLLQRRRAADEAARPQLLDGERLDHIGLQPRCLRLQPRPHRVAAPTA